MKYLLILPIALLVTYSQIIAKWRASTVGSMEALSIVQRITRFMMDPVILSAYAAALLASFAWLYVITKLPLSIAFPIYIGTTFVMVLFGGWYFLNENFTIIKVLAVTLILSGVILGLTSDA